MLIRKPSDIPSSEMTSKSTYDAYRRDRRAFLKQAGILAGSAAMAGMFPRAAHALSKERTRAIRRRTRRTSRRGPGPCEWKGW